MREISWAFSNRVLKFVEFKGGLGPDLNSNPDSKVRFFSATEPDYPILALKSSDPTEQ